MRLNPPMAAAWPRHPVVLLDQAMAEIGRLAAGDQSLRLGLQRHNQELAYKTPLASEPFLISGALAQFEGQDDRSERLYLEARERDPRSTAARYFLAERYLRTGRIELALVEMGALSRLTGGAGVFAPALAQYAQRRGAVEQLRNFFRTSPEFETPVISNLAADANNLDVILGLWSGRPASSAPTNETPKWQVRLLAALVQKGDYGRAYHAWRRFAGLKQPHSGLFNPQFQAFSAPPPFNWTFGSQGGLAEPTSGGRLDVIYFGSDEALLAQQLLLLGPGRYRLSADVRGEPTEGADVAWSLVCQPSGQPVMRLPLGPSNASSFRLQANFDVSPGCPAQLLKLSGLPGETRKTTEFVVSNLQLIQLAGA